MTELVLSLFPGVGLLDRAFAAAGFCIVQAQDKITGGDIRDFAGVPGRRQANWLSQLNAMDDRERAAMLNVLNGGQQQ